MNRNKVKFLSVVLSLFVMFLMVFDLGVSQAQQPEMLQEYTIGGHVLRFQPDGVHVVGSDHILKLAFLNANHVTPLVDQPSSNNSQSPSFGKITYANLWDGISLIYEAVGSGIVKSSYFIEAGANVDHIRLHYNVPVHLDHTGKLLFCFDTGHISESAPVAWQQIAGEQVSVAVSFAQLFQQEVGFKLGEYDPTYPIIIDPTLQWNTFLGSTSDDYSTSIAFDGSGNVYVTGYSYATWGSPLNPYAGGQTDGFVAKFNNSGSLLWHTFLGSSSGDEGFGITVDGSGNVYLTGSSGATWGSPINDYVGNSEVFVAKLNTNGALQWNTFMGSIQSDNGRGIALDAIGNIYVAGYSSDEWDDPPINPYAGGGDAFAAKLNSSGEMQWHTFMGNSGFEAARGIAIDGSGNLYVTGYSNETWGSPINSYAGQYEAFAAKLNNSGDLQWNTFMGSSSWDFGNGIAVDGSGNVYVTGQSYEPWGSPITAHAGGGEAFVAKLNASGVLQWNTFLGSTGYYDEGRGIAVDGNNNLYVTGYSDVTWGSPDNPHAGAYDAFAAKLNSSAILQWNTFLGSSDSDEGYSIAADGNGNVYVTGVSRASWNSPVNDHAGQWDVFVARLTEPPPTAITLASFTATVGQDAILITWTTATEANNAGFNIYRSQAENGDYVKINDTMILAQGDAATGHSYSFTDRPDQAGTYYYKLEDISITGQTTFHGPIQVTGFTSVATDQMVIPNDFKLSQNYPNPFNPETCIQFALPKDEQVRISIYDIKGQLVQTIVNERKAAGTYSVVWNGRDENGVKVTSGVYFYRMDAGKFAMTKKMILMK